MKTVLAPRASAILYDVLRSGAERLTYLLPANVCPIVPITLLKARVPFEFVDIASETLHMDLDQVEDRLRSDPERYGGILYAHTYGDARTPREFFDHVKRRWNHLIVIDDRLCFRPRASCRDGADVVLYSTACEDRDLGSEASPSSG
jgi:hypothetical protein